MIKLRNESDWNLENVEILEIRGNGVLKLDNGRKCYKGSCP